MADNYWNRLHRRAWKESLHALRIETGERVVISFLVLITTLAVIWFSGTPNGHDLVYSELILKIGLTICAMAVFPIVYVYKLLSLPEKFDNEAREEIIKLNDSLCGNDSELNNSLNNLFNEAQGLCGVTLSQEYGVDEWRNDITNLLQKAHDTLHGKISHVDLNVLLTAPMGQQLYFRGRITEAEKHTQHVIHYFRERLMGLIEKI